MRYWIWLLLAVTPAPGLVAQQFEVASVRPSGPTSIRGSAGGPGRKDSTRFTFGKAEMLSLILTAWDMRGFQVVSAIPLDKDIFDIAATVPAGATKEEFRVMLQKLLKDRFALKVHMESREFSGYELVIAKSGFKLQDGAAGMPGKEPEFQFPANASRMVSRNTNSGGYSLVHVVCQLEPMSLITQYLGREEPIVDHTGLTGKYSFTLDYSIDLGVAAGGLPPAPSLFTAVEKGLGLQLVSKKLPFDVVVVESFNRQPTEN